MKYESCALFSCCVAAKKSPRFSNTLKNMALSVIVILLSLQPNIKKSVPSLKAVSNSNSSIFSRQHSQFSQHAAGGRQGKPAGYNKPCIRLGLRSRLRSRACLRSLPRSKRKVLLQYKILSRVSRFRNQPLGDFLGSILSKTKKSKT